MKPLIEFDTLPRGFVFRQRYPNTSYWRSVGLANQPHLGLDLICPVGTKVFAHSDGDVQRLNGKQGGLTIHMRDDKDNLVRHMHLSKIVKTGKVKKGDLIALTGNTGASTAPHIHIDISKGRVLRLGDIDNFIDPQLYFNAKPMIPDWKKEFVDRAKALGISNGERPMDNITRGEAMGMTLNLLDHILENYNLKKK